MKAIYLNKTFFLFQSRTPALVFEHVNNTDFKVQYGLCTSNVFRSKATCNLVLGRGKYVGGRQVLYSLPSAIPAVFKDGFTWEVK